jgi:hypothetical protein
MILLNKSNSEEHIIVTLNESKTIASPYYLFVFTNVTTKEVVNLILNSQDDESLYTQRFNDFIIDTSSIFEDATVGQYQYQVYEQESGSNTDITGLNMVECGKMNLTTTATEIYTTFDTETNYTT